MVNSLEHEHRAQPTTREAPSAGEAPSASPARGRASRFTNNAIASARSPVERRAPLTWRYARDRCHGRSPRPSPAAEYALGHASPALAPILLRVGGWPPL